MEEWEDELYILISDYCRKKNLTTAQFVNFSIQFIATHIRQDADEEEIRNMLREIYNFIMTAKKIKNEIPK